MLKKNKLMICTIGKLKYSVKLKNNTKDIKVFTAIAERVGKLYLIVQSSSHYFTVSRHKNIIALFIPHIKNQFLNHIWFIIMSIIFGYKLNIRSNIDVFQASEPTGSGIAGIILKLITGKKFLLHLQGDLFNLPRNQFSWFKIEISRFMTRLACKFADKIRCVSNSIITEAKKYGISSNKLVFVPSRCDVKKFDPKVWQDAREELRNQLKIRDKKVIMFLGTLSVHKGLSYLLRAMPDVFSYYPDSIVLLIGSGPLMNELESQASELCIADKVKFCGHIAYDEVPLYLSTADIFVFPSIDEGLPRAVMEAMAMELPVVASRVGGIPEIILHKETGLLVDPCQPSQIAESLIWVLNNESLAREMGVRARQKIVSQYSFERGIEKYVDLLYEVYNGTCNDF